MREELIGDVARRAAELREAILSEEGGCHSASRLESILWLDEGTVEADESSGAIIGVIDRGEKLYPRWQYLNGRPYPIISWMLNQYQPDNSFKVLCFFLNDHEALPLGRRPLDLMRADQDDSLRQLWKLEKELDG